MINSYVGNEILVWNKEQKDSYLGNWNKEQKEGLQEGLQEVKIMSSCF